MKRRLIVVLILCAGLAACGMQPCGPGGAETDGGIGGTGSCARVTEQVS